MIANFGEFNPDGSLKKDVFVCAITGREIARGDAMVRVSGTPYFYRVKAWCVKILTPERRAEVEASVRPAAPSTTEPEVTTKPRRLNGEGKE